MKSCVFKTVRNFLVANLCALIPLWAALFGGMPDKMLVYMRENGKKPVLLLDGGHTMVGRDRGEWAGGRIWGFPMREDMELANLVFSLPGDLGPESVQTIELRKWWGSALRKQGGGLVQTDAANNCYAFPDSRFDSVGIASVAWAVLLFGSELLLFLFSWFSARRHAEESVKSLLPAVAGVAFALALLLQVVLPLQSFLSNRSAFPFSLAELGGDMAVRFSLALGLGTLALLALTRCFGRWILALLLAFAVCAHLEAGVLSMGLPDLKGDWSFFDNPFRARWDAAVWAGVFTAFFGLHPFLKRRYGTAALIASILFASSVLDVRMEPKADASQLIVGEFSSLETVVRSAAYSPDRNVLVFVIDSLEAEVAHKIVEDPDEGAKLKERFPGFTEYLGNIGGGDSSLIAIANLFTGDFPQDANVFDYFVSVYSDRSVLKDYLEEGYEMAVATEALGYGYCTHPVDFPIRDGRSNCFRVPGTGGTDWTLDGFDRFRCLPFGLKAPYAMGVEWNAPTAGFSIREWNVYPILRDGKILPPGRGAFLFVHTAGVHIPVRFDRTGMSLPAPDNSEKACVEMGVFLMKQLGDMFDVYREKGIYDRSMIVVMADHGFHARARPGDVFPSRSRPFLWIKPVGASHAFRSSHLPTGHARLADLLRAASRKVLTEEEIETLIQADVRRFFSLRDGMGPEYDDYEVDKDGHVSSRQGVLMRPLESMRPPELRRRYSLDRNEMGRNKLDIAFRHVAYWPSPKWYPNTPETSFFFRAPDSDKRYALTLSLLCEKEGEIPAEDAVVEFRQPHGLGDWVSHRVERKTEVVLHGLKADADGKIEIECRRGPSLTTLVFFQHLMLEEERNPD